MAKNTIRTEAQLTGFSSRADGSLGFRGCTPELSSSEKVALMDLQGLLIEALFIPKEDKDSELIEVKQEIDLKTPSQRLRAVIFVYYRQQQKKGLKETFPTFYERHLEKLIEYVKSKLEDDK